MTQIEGSLRGIAPLANITLADRAITRAMERAEHLPGMVEFHGPSGWGKSIAANYVANRYRAYYVQAKSVWTSWPSSRKWASSPPEPSPKCSTRSPSSSPPPAAP